MEMNKKLSSRIFTNSDQKLFSKFSGDDNPLHVDEVESRRYLFGSSVVHGINLLLWSLDTWLSKKKVRIKLESIKVSFVKPIKVKDKVCLYVVEDCDNHVILELRSDGLRTTKIEFIWTNSSDDKLEYIFPNLPKKSVPKVISDSDLERQSGKLKLHLDESYLSDLFPNLMSYFSKLQTSLFLSTTRLVGTKCPGLFSIYTELTLSFISKNEIKSLNYNVKRVNRRLGILSMNVLGPSSKGTIQALIRPEQRFQPNITDIQNKINEDEFKNQLALIIGGSRGLGEVTAKILASGSADVKLTYFKGVKDAKKVVNEISNQGLLAECFAYDVLSPNKSDLLKKLGTWRPTHLYYFATPFIFSGSSRNFSIKKFERFCDYYVAGFKEIIDLIGPSEIKNIYYPSTIAIEELPSDMSEYVSAKVAGEIFVNFMKNFTQIL